MTANQYRNALDKLGLTQAGAAEFLGVSIRTSAMLVRVVAPHFCAGIEINERGMCVNAAPILKWCIGKKTDFLRDYFKRKRWKANIVRNLDED